MRLFLLLSLIAASTSAASVGTESSKTEGAAAHHVEPDGTDKYEHCKVWAEQGECLKNADYMKLACPESCEAAKQMNAQIQKQVEGIKSIHQLSAKDIDGNEISFGDFTTPDLG